MKKKNIQWTAGILGAGIALALLDALVLEKLFFQVKTFDIGKVGSSKKLKLVLLTDLHLQKKLWPYYKKLARKVNELQPDLIMITGDTLDSEGEKGPMDRFLGLLEHQIPKVAIAGNHDHKADPSLFALKEVYQKHNCRFLYNESAALGLRGTRLMITGLDDFIEGHENVEAAFSGVGKEEHHLLLVHSPLQQELAKKEINSLNKQRTENEQLTISYIFAGHNHGGQITFLGYAPVLPVKSGDYVQGWYNSQKPFLYVSKGFGTSTIPLRFGARSEVSVFNYFV